MRTSTSYTCSRCPCALTLQVIYCSSKADPELLELLRSPIDPTAAAPRAFDVRAERNSLFMPDKVSKKWLGNGCLCHYELRLCRPMGGLLGGD